MQKIVRVVLITGLVSLLTFAATNHALAQNASAGPVKVKRPFRVKVGTYFPSEGAVRSTVGKSMTSFGIGYDFSATPTTIPLILGFYIADTGKSKNITIDRNTGKVEAGYFAVGAQVRTYLEPDATTLRFFVGGGLGVYSVRAKTYDLEGKTIVSGSKTGTYLGGKIFGGAEWSKRYFLEVESVFPHSVSVGGTPINVSGMGISLGLRF